tara:strand:+ start:679 stop:885 length:207 start_codon:yes stop_codon:yes gene_type:complete
MKVQVFKRAKDVEGNTKAFKLRIDGVKYPLKHGAWFFVDSKEQAEQEAKKEMFKIMFSKYVMEGETMN